MEPTIVTFIFLNVSTANLCSIAVVAATSTHRPRMDAVDVLTHPRAAPTPITFYLQSISCFGANGAESQSQPLTGAFYLTIPKRDFRVARVIG